MQQIFKRQTRLAYNPKVDGNVFKWILNAAQFIREAKQEEIDAIKKAAAKSKRLDRSKVEN